MLNFTLKNVTRQRLGSLLSLNGHFIDTPCFMPVGTAATVKAMSGSEIYDFGYKIIFSKHLPFDVKTRVEIISNHGDCINL